MYGPLVFEIEAAQGFRFHENFTNYRASGASPNMLKYERIVSRQVLVALKNEFTKMKLSRENHIGFFSNSQNVFSSPPAMCGIPVTPVAPTVAKVMPLFVVAGHDDNWVSELRPPL